MPGWAPKLLPRGKIFAPRLRYSITMNIILLNLILSTAENGVIKQRGSIKDTMICNFARGFAKAGHSVTILASDDYRPSQPEQYEGYEVVYFKSRMPRVFKPHLLPWPIGLGKWLRAHAAQCDMVVSSEVFSIGSLIAARVCPEKLVIWQEMAMHQRLLFRLPSLLWHNLAVRTAMRRVLVVPRSLPARQFISQYCPQVSAEIVDHGANEDVLYPSSEVTDSFIVLSQLVERKRVDYIIAQFAALVARPAYSHYVLHIAGDGDQAPALRQLAQQLGVERNVVFHGFMRHSEVAALLRQARAMLVATRADLNMVSIPESIVSGTPIVTNTVPTSAGYIAANRLGVVADDWGADALADVAEHYADYHQACLGVRPTLTRVGCAQHMVQIFGQYRACRN